MAEMSDHFIGTIYFARVAFGLKSDTTNVSVVSDEDVKTAIEYATKAVVPISLYAAQYGDVSLRVHPEAITYNALVDSKTVSDGEIRDIVDDLATRLPADACVAILLPTDMDNSKHPRSEANGYHDCSDIPYINSYIYDDKEKHPFLTVRDETFRYAYTLSHEIAEMAVDPKGSGQPEVCDSCSGAYQTAWICYFDKDGCYLATSQKPPYDPTLGFSYDFYISPIARPGYNGNYAAPESACSYAPVTVSAAAVHTVSNPHTCDGFYTQDDDYRHVLVASTLGDVDEIFFHPKKGLGVARLLSAVDLLDLSGFYTPDDGYRHAIWLTAAGVVSEHFYGTKGSGTAALANVAGGRHVSGFFSAKDSSRHVIISTDDGKVFDVFYHGKHGSGMTPLNTFAGVVDVAGFYSEDDDMCHAIVATGNGDIVELYYKSGSSAISATTVANIPNPARLAAYYDRDVYYNRRVLVATTGGEIWEVRFQPRAVMVRVRILTTGVVSGLGGFYTTDDRRAHAICLLPSGSVTELFYRD
jgi:hypothetical protein